MFDLLRSLTVPENIHKQYMEGGKAERVKLLKILAESGFDKDVGFIRNDRESESILCVVQSPKRNEFKGANPESFPQQKKLPS